MKTDETKYLNVKEELEIFYNILDETNAALERIAKSLEKIEDAVTDIKL